MFFLLPCTPVVSTRNVFPTIVHGAQTIQPSFPCRLNKFDHHRFFAAACTPFSCYIYISFRHVHLRPPPPPLPSISLFSLETLLLLHVQTYSSRVIPNSCPRSMGAILKGFLCPSSTPLPSTSPFSVETLFLPPKRILV